MTPQIKFTSIFNTVPLPIGKMERASKDTVGLNPRGVEVPIKKGTKVDEKGNIIAFPKWSKYVNVVNKKEAPVMGAIALDTFIGIDIDSNDLFYEFFNLIKHSLDSRAYIALSLPKEADKGGHLLVKHSKQLEEALIPLRATLKTLNIDIQIGKSLIYLATDNNKTKQLVDLELQGITNDEYFSRLDPKEPLVELPSYGLMWLQSKVANHLIENPVKVYESSSSGEVEGANYNLEYLGLYFESINFSESLNLGKEAKDKFLTQLLQKITPRKNFPHIKKIEQLDGIATQWLLEVRRKLSADPSISEDVLHDVLHYINTMRPNSPMSSDKINSDIKRDVNSDFWVFNPSWKTEGLILSDSYNNIYEVLVSISDASFILLNRTNGHSIKYGSYQQISDVVGSISNMRLTRPTLLKRARSVRDINDPKEEPFFSIYEDSLTGVRYPIFNRFNPSEGFRLINNPSLLDEYKEPKLILQFLESLIPNKTLRNLMLGFVKHKATTLNYTPLYFLLVGAGGAGKGVFINRILGYIFGMDKVVHYEVQNFLNNFNSDTEGKFILEIDEPEGLSYGEQEKFIAKLKRVTGSETTRIERKRMDAYDIVNYITPFISANNRIKLHNGELENDRRQVIIPTPNKVVNMFPIKYTTMKGESVVIEDSSTWINYIDEELKHFAYYLGSTDFSFNIQAYNSNAPWQTEEYKEYTESVSTDYDILINAVAKKSLNDIVESLSSLDVEELDIGECMIEARGKTKILVKMPPKGRSLGFKTVDDLLTDADKSPMQKHLIGHTVTKTIKLKGSAVRCSFVEVDGSYLSGIEVSDIS